MGSGGSPRSCTGAALMPQLPVMTVGESLGEFREHGGRANDARVVVGVNVDEARRESQAFGIDDDSGVAIEPGRDGADAVPARKATSTTSGAAPLPSRTVALRMSVSQRNMLDNRIQAAGAQDIG